MDIEKTFAGIGGLFLRPAFQIKSNLTLIKTFIFDWDGVFNTGAKTGESGSPYSEIDSMGINLLRFSRWLSNKKILEVFIITGENNPSAIKLAQRECYNGIFLNFKDKRRALSIIDEKYHVQKENIAVVFDDILDVGIAELCRLAFFVGRKSTPMLENYIKEKGICDYITGSGGGNYAVREVCELIMGMEGSYEKTLRQRIDFTPEYQEYLQDRSLLQPELFDGRTQK